MKKTLLLAALSICLFLAVSGNAKAAEKVSGRYHYVVLNDENKTATITKVDNPGENVVLPSTIDGYTITQLGKMQVNSYGNLDYDENLRGRIALFSTEAAKKITQLTLPKKLTKIGVQALKDCVKVKKVTLPTSLNIIGAQAFAHCRSLKTVTIPKKVKGIGGEAFLCCSAMQKVTFKTTHAKVGTDAFATGDEKSGRKSKLKKIVLPYNYKGYLKIRAFSGYVGTTFTWRNFNTYNEGFFAGCHTLKKIVFPKKLKIIDIPSQCFDDSLSGLKSLTIPAKVKTVYVGQHTRNLKSITIKGKRTVLKGDPGMSKRMISVNTVRCRKNSKAWKAMKKFFCPDFSKKFKKKMGEYDYYTRKTVYTKKVKVKKI